MREGVGTGQTMPARTATRLEIAELTLAHQINDIYAPVLITTRGYSYL